MAAVPLGHSILSDLFLRALSPTRRSPAPHARPLCRGRRTLLSLGGRGSHPTVPRDSEGAAAAVPGSGRNCSGKWLLNFCYGLFLLFQLGFWSLGWFFFFS